MTDLIRLLEAWMPAQRWYRGPKRGRARLTHLGGYVLADPAAERDVHLVTVPIILDESTPERVVYQVPLVLRAVDASVNAVGYVGSVAQNGRVSAVVDGAHDPAFARAVIHLVARERVAPGADAADPTVAYGHAMPGVQAGRFIGSRALMAEQSNTSIVCDRIVARDDRRADGAAEGPERGTPLATPSAGPGSGRDAGAAGAGLVRERERSAPLIIKVYRTLWSGENPDVVLQTALAAAGSTAVPSVFGHMSGQWRDPRVPGGRAEGHLAFVQEFLPGVEDAWRIALRVGSAGRDFSVAARELGQSVGEMHAVLRSAMPVAATAREDVAASIAAMRARFEETVAVVPELAPLRERVLAVYSRAERATWPTRQRIHGDLHLGQVLAVPDHGWVFIDFEGEPIRSLDERAALDVPQRDLAGILRSIDYAAGAIAFDGGRRPTASWVARARRAFLDGYRDSERRADEVRLEAAGQHGLQAESFATPESRRARLRRIRRRDGADARGWLSAVPGSSPASSSPGAAGVDEPVSDGASALALLDAYELDKAVYEALYEAHYRPQWLPIPMDAIKRIIGTGARGAL